MNMYVLGRLLYVRSTVSSLIAVGVTVFLAPLACQSTFGSTIVLAPVFDQAARDSTPRDGIFEELFPPDEDSLQIYNATIDSEARGVLEFQLPQIGRSMLESATLHLTDRGIGHGGVDEVFLRVDGYSGNGVVDVSDFAASSLITQLQYPNDTFGVPPINVDVTSFVRDILASSGSFAGFALRTAPYVSFYVVSSDHSYPSVRPTLELSFAAVPEPNAVLQLIVALLSVAVYAAISSQRPQLYRRFLRPSLLGCGSGTDGAMSKAA